MSIFAEFENLIKLLERVTNLNIQLSDGTSNYQIKMEIKKRLAVLSQLFKIENAIGRAAANADAVGVHKFTSFFKRRKRELLYNLESERPQSRAIIRAAHDQASTYGATFSKPIYNQNYFPRLHIERRPTPPAAATFSKPIYNQNYFPRLRIERRPTSHQSRSPPSGPPFEIARLLPRPGNLGRAKSYRSPTRASPKTKRKEQIANDEAIARALQSSNGELSKIKRQRKEEEKINQIANDEAIARALQSLNGGKRKSRKRKSRKRKSRKRKSRKRKS